MRTISFEPRLPKYRYRWRHLHKILYTHFNPLSSLHTEFQIDRFICSITLRFIVSVCRIVMQNRTPPLEETQEVLLKIHLRILFPPEEDSPEEKTNSWLPIFFYNFFYHKLGLNIFVLNNFFWEKWYFLMKL